jgi:hypothetical protein
LLNCFFYEKAVVFSKSNKNYNLLVKINSLNESLYLNHYKILNDIETIKYIGDDKYQIHLNITNYSSTLIITIKEKIITNISLLN